VLRSQIFTRAKKLPIGAKFCTMISNMPCFIMSFQNFEGHTPKNFRGQNMQNLARFWKTLKFCDECLRDGWRFSKLDFYSIYRDSSCVRRNKFGEIWSSNLGDLDVKLYPPKAHFSKEHILAPSGCCAKRFLHALENHQVLLAHSPTKTPASLQLFSKGGQKLP